LARAREYSGDRNAEARLQLFLKRCSQLLELEYVKQGVRWEIHLFGESEESSNSGKPEEEHLRSFLLLFRQFLSESEPVYIKRIFNDVIRCLVDNELKSIVIETRDLWNSSLRCGPFRMIFEEENITPENALDLWINGEYFHSDADKAAKLQKLGKGQGGLARIQLVTSLPELVQLVLYTRCVVEDSFKRNLFNFGA
jgi:hypothetical protein